MQDVVPLFVVSYGRSGSTALMRALGVSDHIGVPPAFPHETRMAQYIVAGQMLGLAGDAPAALEWERVTYVPHQPFDKVAGQWFEERRSGFFARPHLLEDYAMLFANAGGSPPRFLAEKAMGLGLVRPALEADPRRRAVLLLRDPRDIFISAKAFNRRRGFLSFGESGEPGGDEAMLRAIVAFGLGALATAEARPGQVLILRYEDMIRAPASAFAALLSWLGIEPAPGVAEAMAERIALVDAATLDHMTSADASDSVDRWRGVIPGSRFARLFEVHGEALETLGYERA